MRYIVSIDPRNTYLWVFTDPFILAILLTPRVEHLRGVVSHELDHPLAKLLEVYPVIMGVVVVDVEYLQDLVDLVVSVGPAEVGQLGEADPPILITFTSIKHDTELKETICYNNMLTV